MAQNDTHFTSPLVAMGQTLVGTKSPAWQEWNLTSSEWVMTFPRRAFVVEPEGRSPELLSPGRAILAHPGRRYRRRALEAQGEHTDWLWLRPDELARLMRDGAGWNASRRWLRSLPGELLLQQRLLSRWSQCKPASFELEEYALTFIRNLFEHRSPENVRQLPKQRRGVRKVLEQLVTSSEQIPPLEGLARSAGWTASHLCVAIKQVTGLSLRENSRNLRLGMALQELEDQTERKSDLIDIALGKGFSSHSHFSARFRTYFGCTPSAARRQLTRAKTQH